MGCRVEPSHEGGHQCLRLFWQVGHGTLLDVPAEEQRGQAEEKAKDHHNHEVRIASPGEIFLLSLRFPAKTVKLGNKRSS